MTFEEFLNRVRMSHPHATSAQVTSMITQALLEEPVFDTKNNFATIDVVEDQRWYTLPDRVVEIERVWYKDDGGKWQELKELIGAIDTEDTT